MATWKFRFVSRSKFEGHAKRSNSWPDSKVKVKHELHIAWAHFVHLGALKIYLLPSLETHVQGYVHLLLSLETHDQGYPASCELIFCILAAWKCDFYRVMKPMLQKFVALCEHICSFMATCKCVLIHGHPKRPNSRPGSKVKVKHELNIARAHLVHFGALKIHLMPIL